MAARDVRGTARRGAAAAELERRRGVKGADRARGGFSL